MRGVPQRVKNSSGYTNVDILGNEDLFPNEGFEFPPHEPKQSTKDRYVSVDFPLNTTINTTKLDTQAVAKPPTPVVDKPFPKVKSHRAKLIYDTTIGVRKQQIDYRNKLEEYNREIAEEEKDSEMRQIAIAQSAIEQERKRKFGEKEKLKANYEEQFRLHKRQAEMEKEKERQEVIEMKKRQAELDEEDKMKEKIKKDVQETFKTEFHKRNKMLQDMKATKHQREKEEEKEIAKKAESLSKVQEERARRDEEVRLEKTKRRAIVVDMQAKNLAQQKKQIDDFQEKAESQASLNAELERERAENARKKAQEDRHQEWLRLRKENQVKNRPLPKKAFPARIIDVDEEKFNEEQAKIQKKMYQQAQMKQAKIKAQKEKEEIEKDIREENENIARTTAQFNASLKKLQESVPQELGLTVPEYKVSMKISNMI